MWTEEEAKMKWCPESRTLEWDTIDRESSKAVAASVNRSVGWDIDKCSEKPDFKYRHTCIGSECMAWRWTERLCVHKEKGTFHTMEAMNPSYSNANQFEPLPPKGYCGKAGTP